MVQGEEMGIKRGKRSWILVVLLIMSGSCNVWFYWQREIAQHQVNRLIYEKDKLRTTYEALQRDYNDLQAEYSDYGQKHIYTNEQYETAREESYSNGYNDAYFNFYYVKPKSQKYGLESLKTAVRQVTWTRSYEEGVFDCSEMSAYIEWYLENQGFHAIILVGECPFDSGSHAWVLAETDKNKYMPIEATQPRVVLWDDKGFYDYFEYELDFEKIQEALSYSQEGFDWWTVYP